MSEPCPYCGEEVPQLNLHIMEDHPEEVNQRLRQKRETLGLGEYDHHDDQHEPETPTP